MEQEDGYLEQVDHTASQEHDCFGTMINKAERGELDPKGMDLLRRCDRLKDKRTVILWN